MHCVCCLWNHDATHSSWSSQSNMYIISQERTESVTDTARTGWLSSFLAGIWVSVALFESMLFLFTLNSEEGASEILDSLITLAAFRQWHSWAWFTLTAVLLSQEAHRFKQNVGFSAILQSQPALSPLGLSGSFLMLLLYFCASECFCQRYPGCPMSQSSERMTSFIYFYILAWLLYVSLYIIR